MKWLQLDESVCKNVHATAELFGYRTFQVSLQLCVLCSVSHVHYELISHNIA